MQQRMSIRAVLVVILLSRWEVSAGEAFSREGLWGSLEAGFGHVRLSGAEITERDNRFFLAFAGGYAPDPRFLVGLELSGWVVEPGDYNAPEKGEGLSQVLAIARYFPRHGSDLFLKAGAGYVSDWSNRPGEPRRKSGWGQLVGVGYEIPLSRRWLLTPCLAYAFGRADRQRHRVVTGSVGFTRQ